MNDYLCATGGSGLRVKRVVFTAYENSRIKNPRKRRVDFIFSTFNLVNYATSGHDSYKRNGFNQIVMQN